jgi:hypothetical protein
MEYPTMTEHAEPLELGNTSELLQVAEEVRRSHTPRLLRHAGEDLAIVVPIVDRSKTHRRGKGRSEEDYEAFRSAAGSWKGLVDADQLIEDIYESRRISTDLPVDL